MPRRGCRMQNPASEVRNKVRRGSGLGNEFSKASPLSAVHESDFFAARLRQLCYTQDGGRNTTIAAHQAGCRPRGHHCRPTLLGRIQVTTIGPLAAFESHHTHFLSRSTVKPTGHTALRYIRYHIRKPSTNLLIQNAQSSKDHHAIRL